VGAAADRAAPHGQGCQAGNVVSSTGVDLKLWAWGGCSGRHARLTKSPNFRRPPPDPRKII
jgi:hypothetical protein